MEEHQKREQELESLERLYVPARHRNLRSIRVTIDNESGRTFLQIVIATPWLIAVIASLATLIVERVLFG